jgi:CheY-like chemotaxis protein
VKLRCEISKAFEKSGDYEKACEALGGLWRRIGERPDVDGLAPEEAAEALLQVGRLTGSLGSAKQVDGAQESAKNLISESISLFEKAGNGKKVAEAQTAISVCYWREGAFDEARVMLKEALNRLPAADGELRAAALITLAIVERSASRYDTALEILSEAAPLVDANESDALKGSFHNQRAITLENLASAERRLERFDQALIEYAAASFHFEQAGHLRYCARVENNLGMLFRTIGRHDEAHEHLARARSFFVRLKDVGSVAQVDETRARVQIAEGRLEEAEKTARAAVQSLEDGGEQALLAEALATCGVALARLGRHAEARQSLERAVEIAERGGDPEDAGQASLTIIEELDEQTTARELCEIFERASNLLAGSQNSGTLVRLNACARRVISAISSSVAPSRGSEESSATVEERWDGFSLKREILRYESELIANALADAGGVVSRAAKLLGFRHHQTFVALLNNRHNSLLHARTPINPRKRSVARVRAPRRTATHRADRETRPVTILFVEDNRLVADAISDTLEFEGWRVESCPDGGAALRKIESDDHFDLILLDEDLPGVSGLELTQRARGLQHRQDTPIIIISATNCQAAARDAGANAFLKKPQDILALVPTISQLLDLKAVV